jgi:hypothetical protein
MLGARPILHISRIKVKIVRIISVVFVSSCGRSGLFREIPRSIYPEKRPWLTEKSTVAVSFPPQFLFAWFIPLYIFFSFFPEYEVKNLRRRRFQVVSEIQQLLLTVLKAIPNVNSSIASSSDGKAGYHALF